MQRLINNFNLNFIKKFLFSILLVGIFFPISSHALVGSTSCGGSSQYAILGDQYLPGPTSTDLGSIGKSTTLYHQLKIPADGNLTLSFTHIGNKNLTFEVGKGSTCPIPALYTFSNVTSTTTAPVKFSVSKGDVIYIKVINPNANAQEYTIHAIYDSPVILVSLVPPTISVPEGFSSIDLNISLSRGTINGDLNVTYLRTDNNTTHSILVPRWYSDQILRIDIDTSDPRMVQGYDFNITLLSVNIVVDPTISATRSEEAIILQDAKTTVISIGQKEPDLYLVKGDSTNHARLGETFSYSIAVTNRGSAPASEVSVIDYMPPSLVPYISNISAANWDCSRTSSTITCNYDGDLQPDQIGIIQIFITLPLDQDGGHALLGTVVNTASATSDPIDYNILDNTDTEQTYIVPSDYEETNQVNEMCYTDTTDTTQKKCKKVGNFHYSNGCTATVDIIADNGLSGSLTNVQLTKMYAPKLVNGTCSTSQGTCSGQQPISIEESPSYTSGYIFNLGTVQDGNRIELTDYDSYDGNPNNPANLDGIGIYATYTYLGAVHYGRLKDCSGLAESGIEILASADAIDTQIGNDTSLAAVYNASETTSHDSNAPYSNRNGLKWIQTMVAASPQRQISGVHLDIDTLQATPYSFDGDPKNVSDFVIMPYIVNEDAYGHCTSDTPEPIYDALGKQLVISIPPGYYSESNPAYMSVPAQVRKAARMQLIIVDPNTLSQEGQSCLANSSTGGNIEGIGQCGNSEIHYVGGFGVDAWDRCSLNNGDPCLSSNHGHSGGGNPAYPGYNAFYDNPLGCYMCTFNIQPACSTDDFSIRPEKLDMNITHADAPNLLRAGQPYGVSLIGRDYINNITADYTVTDHSYSNDVEAGETVKYLNNNHGKDINGLLYGVADINRSVVGYMVNGLSSTTTNYPANGAEEAIKVFYTDVGLVDLFIHDGQWAYVDHDDTPNDCTSTTHYYVCGDMNVTFIPHHFDFVELNVTNNAGPVDGNFTYIANLEEQDKMSVRIQTHMEALNAQHGITQNFRAGDEYYENNITVTPFVNDLTHDTDQDGTANDANAEDINDTKVGFDRGTKNIFWNESNGTRMLNINYNRVNNKPYNPFVFNPSQLGISLVSHYEDNMTNNTADITAKRYGTQSGTNCNSTEAGCRNTSANIDGNNTIKLYYGRSKSSKFFYDDVANVNVITPISVVAYCDTFPSCDEFPSNMRFTGQIDEPYWWLVLDHNQVKGDGDVNLTVGPTEPSGGSATVTPASPNSVTFNNAIDNNVKVEYGSGGLPLTVNILHDGTSEWLIYNQFSSTLTPVPFYKVRFVGQAGWAGEGKTGYVVDSNASKQKTRRLQW